MSCVAPCCRRPATDPFGIACSVGCAVHCAAMPLLIAAAPAVGDSWSGGETAHLVLPPLGAGAAIWSMRSGVRRHGRPVVPVLAAAGVALPGVAVAAPHLPEGRSGGEHEAVCTVACCATVTEPLPDDGSAAAALRRAVPAPTPIGGGLLVLAHLVNLFARPRAVGPAAGGSAALPA